MGDRVIFRDTETPESRCPYCDHHLDTAMAADPNHPDVKPEPGDVSVCISCASILVFDRDLRLVASRPGQIELTPALRRAQRAVRSIDRRTMGNG